MNKELGLFLFLLSFLSLSDMDAQSVELDTYTRPRRETKIARSFPGKGRQIGIRPRLDMLGLFPRGAVG